MEEPSLQSRYQSHHAFEQQEEESRGFPNVEKEKSRVSSKSPEHIKRDDNGNYSEATTSTTAAAVFHNSGAGAKYKLMSPAKLPISRSPCTLTIPPGLSPTSFLESPVLLSNIKAEPSPTTGTFSMPQLIQGSSGSGFSLITNSSSINAPNDAKSCNFEFQFYPGPGAASGLKPTGLVGSSALNPHQKESLEQVPDSCLSQPLAPSSLVKHETLMPKESSSPVPAAAHASSASANAAVDSGTVTQKNLSNTSNQVSHSDHKDTISSVVNDRSSEDGYNWRKYGQKLVKGCEFPRSYYKCTYPNCDVRKIFERSPDGPITEIVYKGSHDHPKPQPSRRLTPGALMFIQEEKFDKGLTSTEQEDEIYINAQTSTAEPNSIHVVSPQRENDDGLDGSRLQCANDEIDEDDPLSKRRKLDGSLDVSPVVKPIREPRVVVQTVSEVDILDDGYRWRKYGQKVVRGNPNPRSYYKCTYAGCQVRKLVERASHDPKAVITTYEGKHNHDVPTARTSGHEMAGQTTMGGTSGIRLEENDPISLDLGVGISSYSAEYRTDGQIQMLNSEPVKNQVPATASTRMVGQTSSLPACYGVVDGRITLYGSRENLVEVGGVKAATLQPSNQCPQNLGRILLGP